ncbi:pyridoxamine 5'-phosphate oxidase family protein [Naumannella sp. ID2617S]|nr:pyridoxamine 5'-phosphate oxidase family protein [Naumannella sp. ID2617S]
MSDQRISTLDQLREHYPNEPVGPSIAKELDRLSPLYARWIGASPFCVVSTIGDGGLDNSPRGDAPGFVRVRDEHTLEIPDRRGNNRLDTLRNLLADDRIGLIFVVPGVEECVRVRGRAHLSVDPELLESHVMQGKRPASVIVVHVERVYFQCARAVKRSRLWDVESQVPRGVLPTAGMFTEEAGGFDRAEREAYDAALDQRQRRTLY